MLYLHRLPPPHPLLFIHACMGVGSEKGEITGEGGLLKPLSPFTARLPLQRRMRGLWRGMMPSDQVELKGRGEEARTRRESKEEWN